MGLMQGFYQKNTLPNIWSELLGRGSSTCSIEISEKLFNPHKVAHGAVIYSLADTGMGAALYPSLQDGQICATIEIKINYFRAVSKGIVVCETNVINWGKSVANMESSIAKSHNI